MAGAGWLLKQKKLGRNSSFSVLEDSSRCSNLLTLCKMFYNKKAWENPCFSKCPEHKVPTAVLFGENSFFCGIVGGLKWFDLKSHFPSPHQHYSSVLTSPPGTSCCRCGHTCGGQRSRPVAGRTCCSRSQSNARHIGGEPGSGTGPRGRCAPASATVHLGWSCQSGWPFRSAPHQHLRKQDVLDQKGAKFGECRTFLVLVDPITFWWF